MDINASIIDQRLNALKEDLREQAREILNINDARSLIRDGCIPQVRVLACNNGLSWNQAGQEIIEREKFGDQVTWEHINHDYLIKLLQSTKPVNDTLQFSGQAIFEKFL